MARLEFEVRQGVERISQRLAPSDGNGLKIGVVGLDPLVLTDLETVHVVGLQVERQAHGQVGLDRRIERHHQQFDRIFKAHVRIVSAHQNGAAVLGFADLKVGRVGGGFDKVAFRIDHEQPRLAGGDLSAQNERGVKGGIGVLPGLRVGLNDLAHQIADDLGDLKHGWRFKN